MMVCRGTNLQALYALKREESKNSKQWLRGTDVVEKNKIQVNEEFFFPSMAADMMINAL